MPECQEEEIVFNPVCVLYAYMCVYVYVCISSASCCVKATNLCVVQLSNNWASVSSRKVSKYQWFKSWNHIQGKVLPHYAQDVFHC